MRIICKRTPYIHFTEDQKDRANSVDLAEFLESRGEELERSGREFRWKSNKAITFKENKWFNHYEQRGGGPVQFVREFYNLTYPEAVTMLLNGEQGEIKNYKNYNSNLTKKERAPFALPERSDTMRRVFAYLIKQRFIDAEIITHFAHQKTLYEDKAHHNAVFVGCDENNIPKHAHKKGTYSGGNYRGNVEGSDPKYSFRHIGKSNQLFVFEAPIDMLSFITMNKNNWKSQSYVTLDGVMEHAMLWTLEQNPHITKVMLCLDHDPAGIEAFYRLSELLANKGYTDITPLFPKNKDWNEDRKAQLGFDVEPAKENPKIFEFYTVLGELYHSHKNILPSVANLESIGRQVSMLNKFATSENQSNLTDSLVNIYSLSLVSATEKLKKIDKFVTTQQLAEKVANGYSPHKDKGGIRARCDDIFQLFKTIRQQEKATGIRTTTERENEINNYLSLARESVKTLSFLRLQEQVNNKINSKKLIKL